ncbi:MAG: flgB [Phycisphaerales bacterium]|nr:flgB [Phycisphaerales bacterium]
MFLDQMFNQGSTPVLERMLQFTAARQKLISENVVNISVPNYRQKDLSLEKFQQLLRDRVEERDGSGTARFDDITAELEQPGHGMLFHDGVNRSMEQLMTDQAKNGMMHNFIVELLRKQFQTMEMALKERVG